MDSTTVKNLLKILHLLLYAILGVHFSIIALSLVHDNPISHVHKHQIAGYVNPVFSQNWNLFAPNPIASNRTLLIKFTTYTNADSTESEWLDIKESVHADRSKSFWSPLQRVEKYLGSITEAIVEDQIELRKFVVKNEKQVSKDSIEHLVNLYKVNYGHRSLMKYSRMVYAKLYTDQPDSVYLKYRIVDAEFPRFSKRHTPYDDFQVTYYEFDLKRLF